MRDLVKDSAKPHDEIIKNAFWTYTTAEDVLREINGYALRDNPETGLEEGRSRLSTPTFFIGTSSPGTLAVVTVSHVIRGVKPFAIFKQALDDVMARRR